jgi:hypothetical protein
MCETSDKQARTGSLNTMFSSDIQLHNIVVCLPFIFTVSFTNRSTEWHNTIKKLFHSSCVSFTTLAYRVEVRNGTSFDVRNDSC